MYVINDLDEFVDHIRKVSFDKFNESNDSIDEFSNHLSEEKESSTIDDIISLNEVKTIILSNVKKNKKGTYQFRYKKLIKMVEEINSRIISNLLNILVKKNIIETAFDEKQNDFVFWIKEKNDKE